MENVQVKILREERFAALEEHINDWLSAKQVTIVDIKYSVAGQSDSTVYSAMIIYSES